MVWTNLVQDYQGILESYSEVIELCSGEDKESNEEDNKKEKVDKYLLSLNISDLDLLLTFKRSSHSVILEVNPHAEITTPPPQFFLI